MASAAGIHHGLAEFLENENWLETWPRLQANHALGAGRQRAFHTWFDALRTLRLIHVLCESGYPRDSDETLLVDCIRSAGFDPPRQRSALLEWLRARECVDQAFVTRNDFYARMGL